MVPDYSELPGDTPSFIAPIIRDLSKNEPKLRARPA